MEMELGHRPYPPPARSWALSMRWHDLLFIHWPVPADTVRPLLPPELTLDTYDGRAWIGLIPFRMSGVRPRFLPALPGVGAFEELNLRTYAVAGDRPGVWFFSLDVASRLAVEVARVTYHLPYFRASMRCETEAGWLHYRSRRCDRRGGPAALDARYRPCGPVFQAKSGSLESFLVDRYCLYAADRSGGLWRGEIHHAAWPLQPAELELVTSTMTHAAGLDLDGTPASLLFAACLEVVAWGLTSVHASTVKLSRG